VGETGGKDFIFAHASAHVPALVTALVRGAFEFQGQKCARPRRGRSSPPAVAKGEGRRPGPGSGNQGGRPDQPRELHGRRHRRQCFKSIKGCDHAKSSADAEILIGGKCDDALGYFIQPTVVLAKSPTRS
jgi:1-pyrroline-5-carboxylate dehydrogenase